MEERVLNVETRSKTGKGICRRLRVEGLVPGVVFGKGMESVPVTLQAKELGKAIAGEGGQNHILTLKGGGSLDGNMVIVSDVLVDCLKGHLRHVDLHKIDMANKIKVTVAINLVGTAAGVKAGGLLDFAMHEVEVECLPGIIPEHIDVNVSALEIGASIHVSDIVTPVGIKILADPRASVVSILGKAREEVAATA
jgi:large subunit ribosomal protein L25